MIQIDSFITALKVTWLRRHILQPDCSWSSLSNINMNSTLYIFKRRKLCRNEGKRIVKSFLERCTKELETFCKSVIHLI